MPSEKVDVVRRQFAAFDDGGLDAVVDFWHPDIEWRAVEGAADDAGPIHGRAALRRYYEDWVDALEGLRAELEEVLAEEGDRVAVTMRNSGRGRASGVPIEGRYHVVCTIRDGLIVCGREYATAAQAIAAVAAPGC
jgi:ketosteroid isomerase-like protein